MRPEGLADLLAEHPDTEPTAARKDDDIAGVLCPSGTIGKILKREIAP